MAGDPDVSQVFRVPGRLSVGPTDLSAAWPHGGTGLGTVSEIVISPAVQYAIVTGDEFGGEVLDYVELGSSWILGAVLREWNSYNVDLIFNTATGAVSGEKVVSYPSASRPGSKVSSVVLLFTPYEQDVHPAFLAYRAIPLVPETTALKASIMDELVVPVMFHCIRNAAGTGQVKFGLLEDLTL